MVPGGRAGGAELAPDGFAWAMAAFAHRPSTSVAQASKRREGAWRGTGRRLGSIGILISAAQLKKRVLAVSSKAGAMNGKSRVIAGRNTLPNCSECEFAAIAGVVGAPELEHKGPPEPVSKRTAGAEVLRQGNCRPRDFRGSGCRQTITVKFAVIRNYENSETRYEQQSQHHR